MDLSWLCVDDFKLYESGCDPENLKKLWMKLITKRRRLNHDSRLILLPEVILSGASVDVIPVYEETVEDKPKRKRATTRKTAASKKSEESETKLS